MEIWMNAYENKLTKQLFDKWLATDDSTYTSSSKNEFSKLSQLRFFKRQYADIKIPDLFDRSRRTNTPGEKDEFNIVIADQLELVLSGGRSRKKRRQYRIKKSRSRSRR